MRAVLELPQPRRRPHLFGLLDSVCGPSGTSFKPAVQLRSDDGSASRDPEPTNPFEIHPVQDGPGPDSAIGHGTCSTNSGPRRGQVSPSTSPFVPSSPHNRASRSRKQSVDRRPFVRKLTDEQVTQAGTLYANGLSLIHVAERFNVNAATIRREFNKAGLDIRARRG